MINHIYQLVNPRVFSVLYSDISLDFGVIVRPEFMSICHADQRYYHGTRDAKILRKKLPMALIHECCGRVLHDSSSTFTPGDSVVFIPNIPGRTQPGIYENYSSGSRFLSSGIDGFMRELVVLPPHRLVKINHVCPTVAAISEFVSVGMHAVKRFEAFAHDYRNTIGVWGDGSLAYVVSCILCKRFPESNIVVVGKNATKLLHFPFVDRTFFADNLPQDFMVDHAFECVGGEGSSMAINDIVGCINPQGTVMLLGVSENKVLVNTRDILEKGLTFVGSSRSGREDFEDAIELMSDNEILGRISGIIYEDKPVCGIDDIHRVFATDMSTLFKTVFEWKV